MDWSKPEMVKDDAGDPCLTADWDPCESEKGRLSSCKIPDDATTSGSWSQRSISRSLQKAETLLKSTFNPNLKWLFNGRSQDEDMEEGNFVVAPNLVSRSSARLIHLQHALLTVASQWQHVGGLVCVKGLQTEGGVAYLPFSSFLQGHYRSMWKLLEQRSLLLFIHEYIRRVRLIKLFIFRVSHLLGEQPNNPHLNQVLSSWFSSKVSLGSLSQELRVHLNHWSFLFSKVQSDNCLRRALVQKTQLLVGIKQTLDLLSLQVMVLMEQYTYFTLSATAQADLNSVPTEILQDIVAGVDLFNQAVEEQRAQRCTTQLRSTVLQKAQYNIIGSSLPTCKGHHPAAISVMELTMILAAHHAEMAAKQLDCWMFKQTQQLCLFHEIRKTCSCSDKSMSNCGSSALRSEHPTRHMCCKTSHYISSLNLHRSMMENHRFVFEKSTDKTSKSQTSQWQTCMSHPGVTQCSENSLDSVHPTLERGTDLENGLFYTFSTPSVTSQYHPALLLSDVCQQDCSSAKILFQVLVSFSDLLAPLVAHTPTSEAPPKHVKINTITHSLSPCAKNELVSSTSLIMNVADLVEVNRLSTELSRDQSVDGGQQDYVGLQKATVPEVADRDGDTVKKETVVVDRTMMEPDNVGAKQCSVPSLQWLDLGHSQVCDYLLGQYYSLFQTFGSKALWLQLHVSHTGNNEESITLQDSHWVFHILLQISQALETNQVPVNCRAILEDVSQHLLVHTSHAQWDYEMCRGLGSALKDKCLTDVRQSIQCLLSLPKQDKSVVMSATMEHFLLLTPPLLSSLHCHQSHSRALGSISSVCNRLALQRQTMSMVLSTVQLSAVWVMSKAHRFLSSWSLNKFLLITQGDLKVLRESLEVMVHQIKSLMNLNSEHPSALHNHSQLQLRQQFEALDRAVCELQTFSSLVLKTFSSDCKRLSGEIFEQTMPSAVHWRPSHRTGLPVSPSEYASLAAQTVIGQVLESVAPLSDDARVQALSITTTAFMEAWMEHILKQKIKFSVQGALQLKQDFDFIKNMIQSDKYGLSADLHHQLLSLRVFQQVDSAIVCLLQQPQAKPYLQSRAWGPFTRCCPPIRNRGSIDAAEGSSITNLRCMEGEDLSQADSSVVTTNIHPLDPSTPGESYLAPSVDLGAAQQEWLNLRIHSNSRHWRLPGLHCLSKAEP